MAGVARTGQDSAGGTITGVLVASVIINGSPVAVVGDAVAPHGKPPHAAAVMAQGSGTVRAGGIAVCRAGDAASCGHVASGSSDVSAG
jgi:uncharacterized Zn-binding protein involved in type VI secretion